MIFSLLDRFRIKTNLINNSAVDLSLCVEYSWHIDELIKALNAENFNVEKIDNVELLTIRNYNAELYQRYASQQDLLVRQSNPTSVRVVLREARF